MEPTKYIWHNGKFLDWQEAKTHVLTHGLHYGAGAFEGIRAYETEAGPAVFRLKEHIQRLFFSSGVVGIKIPFTEDEIRDAVLRLLEQNAVKHAYIRPVVYYGYGIMGVNPGESPIECAIACWPWGRYIAHECASIKISSYCRMHPSSTVSGAKLSGHYLNSMLAVREAKAAGYDEALLLDVNGCIAEGSGENFFMVKGGKIYTPRTTSILPGITRATIIGLAGRLGIEVEQKDIRPEEAFGSDETFFTGTAAEVSPIGAIDDHTIGDGHVGPITKRLREVYLNVVHGRVPEFRSYLSYVHDAAEQKVPNPKAKADSSAKVEEVSY